MRLFIAVAVPDSVKQYARMLRNELGVARADVKWVEYENYHLTLKFLGEVKEPRLPLISECLTQAAEASPAFNLSAGGLGFFPNKMRPRVIWLGIKGEMEKAVFLGGRIDAYLAAQGFEEEKDHRFHLTLGRMRSDLRLNDMLKLVGDLEGKEKFRSFKVEQFHLMKSTLSSKGPVYSVIESFTLKG